MAAYVLLSGGSGRPAGWRLLLLARPPPADSALDLGGARLKLLLHAIGLADQSACGIKHRLWMEVRTGGRQPYDNPGAVLPILGLRVELMPI